MLLVGRFDVSVEPNPGMEKNTSKKTDKPRKMVGAESFLIVILESFLITRRNEDNNGSKGNRLKMERIDIDREQKEGEEYE